MAAPSSQTSFHPEYADAAGGDRPAGTVVLESRDGVLFAVPLALLAKRSTFFKDLAELPVANDDPIPLLSASAPALKFALDYLVKTDPKFPPVPSWDVAFLTDCVDVAFAYGLHIVFLALLDGLRENDPFTGFALESLFMTCSYGPINPPEYRNLLHDWVDELLATPLSTMSAWCRSTLETRAPYALDALERFYARQAEAEAAFERVDEAALRAQQPNLASECVHCILGDWERAHAHWVSGGVALVKDLPDDVGQFVAQTYAKIECPVCRRRMKKYFAFLWTSEGPKTEWYKWPLMLGVEEGWDDDWDEFHTDLYDDLSFLNVDDDMFYEDDDFNEEDDFNEDDDYADDDGETIDTISYCDTDFN
ncbi:uncharacterized protein LOC62_01G001224 [Vanrija pseudolonga]|uniref:BTB domain-containing protein n=1 Tax=Vanrija pseudolonga TaxID=143232 RepID=A0AAF0Y1L4_9TREE|nr:hypothetical protein LOC62_01G001224 [Vanrija pseudolonga]